MWRGGLSGRRARLDVGINSAARPKLAGVQLRGLLEPNDHLTIRLPPLVADETLKMLGKGIRREIRIGHRLLEIRRAEGDDVLVGRQLLTPAELLHTAFRLAPQRGLDLLRHDGAAEHAGKGIADGDL